MAPIKRILCPVDLSEFSRHAFDRAVAIARLHRARVFVLHVSPVASAAAAPAVRFGPEGPGPFGLHYVDREVVAGEMKRFLAVDDSMSVPIAFEVVEATSVHREIFVQAARLGVDVIVMGTHGRSGFERLLLGSTTEKVLRRAMVPVLTVPPRTGDVVPYAPFREVLCAVDFSAAALASLDYAASLVEETGGRLTLLHVVELLPVVYEPSVAAPFDHEADRPALESAAREHLHRFVPCGIRQRSVIDEVVTSGKPYVEILRLAAERRADVIALGVHGRNTLDEFLFGSTTNHVVRRATCPVLTVRAAADGR